MTADIICADARDALAEMDADSVDAVVTDPPYGLEFMGVGWDTLRKGAPRTKTDFDVLHSKEHPRKAEEQAGIRYKKNVTAQRFHQAWAAAALRVLKPGGHLVAFGGTRTHHRLWCALEDAGFEIRDTLCWLYGSGFPKSLDVSKAIDKAAGVEREDLGESPNWRESKRDREKFGSMEVRGDNAGRITAPATDAAHQWDGWGTALKPAWEPICLARKPLIGTVATNVQKHSTGALNVDGCRIDYQGDSDKASATPQGRATSKAIHVGAEPDAGANEERVEFDRPQLMGRWPANVVLDEEAAAMLDAQSGERAAGHHPARHDSPPGSGRTMGGGWSGEMPPEQWLDSGGASRFFLNVKPDECCSLCALPMTPKHDTMSPCKNTDANNAARSSRTIQATIEDTAPKNADMRPVESLARNAQSVGSLCDSCAIGIAQSIVAMQQGRAPESPRGWASISEHNERVLTRCLASFVAHLGNTGTTPTTDSLSLFFGFVRDAMRSSIPTDAIGSGQGQPSRLCYSPKASRAERGKGNNHPTVKPLALMRWLCRLVTPPGGLILDPFIGSGTTAVAAIAEGFRCVGVDSNPEYCETARHRTAQRGLVLEAQ